jgi:rRNA maturation endonuclease Nob1
LVGRAIFAQQKPTEAEHYPIKREYAVREMKTLESQIGGGLQISSAGLMEEPPLPESRSCSRCGASIQADANFCHMCGASLQKSPLKEWPSLRDVAERLRGDANFGTAKGNRSQGFDSAVVP